MVGRLMAETAQKADQAVTAQQVEPAEQPQVVMLLAVKDLTVQRQATPV